MRTLSSLLSSLLFCVSSLQAAEAIVSRDAQIDNVQLHYLTAGHGSATVILLHGFAETSRMWRPIIPLLAEKFTVIAPDLPGIGDSSIPAKTGMLVAAQQIHELARSLKIEKARVVGHDIGLMVAYAYAAQFPNETEKLAVMDAFLPGVQGWEPIYDNPNIWHFRFNGEYPEKLVQGRERTYFEYFWNVLAADKTHSIPEADRKAYTQAYSKPGRMRAGWAYFVSWVQLAKDFSQLSQTKLTMPVLSIVAKKIRIPYPILLTIGGVVLALIPGLPAIHLEPQLVFNLFLPPLLYPAAVFTSWRDFRANLRSILPMAIVLVLLTMTATAYLFHNVVGLPLAVGFVFGAIISPPDAVAALAVTQNLRVPRKIIVILEGESLINDATSFISFRFAVAAVMTGTFSLGQASLQFLFVAAGGICVGLGVGC